MTSILDYVETYVKICVQHKKNICFRYDKYLGTAAIPELRFINVDIMDISGSKYVVSKNIIACSKILASMVYHEIGHIVFHKTFGQQFDSNIVTKVKGLGNLYNIILLYIKSLDSLSLVKKILYSLIFITICVILTKFTKTTRRQYEEIFCDLYSAGCRDKIGLLLTFAENAAKSKPNYFNKFTSCHPEYSSRYGYVKYFGNINMNNKSKFYIFVILTRCYLGLYPSY